MPAPTHQPGWRDRGRLPHANFPGLLQAITFRLADSLPREVVERIAADIKRLPADQHDPKHLVAKRKHIQEWLDRGRGSCVLRTTAVRDELAPCLRIGDGVTYALHASCIMPNHVHAVLRTTTQSLGDVVKAWKGISSRRINLILSRSGTLWYREYYDRYLRDQEHTLRALRYVIANPVQAGLTDDWTHWPGTYLSADCRWVVDGWRPETKAEDAGNLRAD